MANAAIGVGGPEGRRGSVCAAGVPTPLLRGVWIGHVRLKRSCIIRQRIVSLFPLRNSAVTMGVSHKRADAHSPTTRLGRYHLVPGERDDRCRAQAWKENILRTRARA